MQFIYEDYESTYDELLDRAKVPSLKIRRMCTMTIECFKILNKMLDIQILSIYKEYEQLPMVRTLLNMLQIFYGMTYLMILEKYQI